MISNRSIGIGALNENYQRDHRPIKIGICHETYGKPLMHVLNGWSPKEQRLKIHEQPTSLANDDTLYYLARGD